ncbi:MAG TPA: SDR family oxidoreductase [Casimicrobiaceae bacterium]|nr:SDR family oxidoreductase [Casimicrobiaceae bacterium]
MSDAVLVTGVAQGIGRAIAEHLVAQGYRVLGIDIAADAPSHLAAFEKVDITDASAALAALARLTAQFAVTRLVNNVGSSFRQNLAESDGTSQRRLDRLNLGSALLCLQAVLPAMRAARFGRVVNITSRAVHGRETRSAYAGTKAGLAALTRSWALELAHEGIAVNAVAPGMINTELFRRNNPPDRPDVYRLQQAIPMQRVGEPQEVARAVAFFLDASVTYITGQTLFVCGGLSLGTFGAQSPTMLQPQDRSTAA